MDHLHIRGENVCVLEPVVFTIGSPPHTWRKRTLENVGFNKGRITSTYVEKTPHQKCMERFGEDHLHIRGENSLLIFYKLYNGGSPPHTWRKPIDDSTVNLSSRITSTYVEKTVL